MLALWAAGCSSNSGDPTGTTSAAVCNALPPLAPKATYTVGFSQLWEPPGNPWRETNTACDQYDVVAFSDIGGPDAAEGSPESKS